MEASCLRQAWLRHEGELFGWLRHSLGERARAEDLLQEVYLKAHLQGRDFCSVAQPRAWLFQVARNALTDQLRRRRDYIELPEDLAEPEAQPPLIVDGLADCLPRALILLSETDRAAIELCDQAGISQADYARRQGLSLPGAKSRVQRARARLKAHLIANCQIRFDALGRVCCFTPRRS